VDCTGSGAASATGHKWLRTTPFTLTHADTGLKLYTARDAQFNNNNCRGCPIIGQLEMSCIGSGASGDSSRWRVDDGILFPDLTKPKKPCMSLSSP